MNPWAPLLGDTVPRDIPGLPAHKHILADEIDHSTLEPASKPGPKRVRTPKQPARAVNHWPLIGSATASEIRAAADRAWGRIGAS